MDKQSHKASITKAIEALEHAQDMIGQTYIEEGFKEEGGYECPHIKEALQGLIALRDAVPDKNAKIVDRYKEVFDPTHWEAVTMYEAAKLLQEAIED